MTKITDRTMADFPYPFLLGHLRAQGHGALARQLAIWWVGKKLAGIVDSANNWPQFEETTVGAGRLRPLERMSG